LHWLGPSMFSKGLTDQEGKTPHQDTLTLKREE